MRFSLQRSRGSRLVGGISWTVVVTLAQILSGQSVSQAVHSDASVAPAANAIEPIDVLDSSASAMPAQAVVVAFDHPPSSNSAALPTVSSALPWSRPPSDGTPAADELFGLDQAAVSNVIPAADDKSSAADEDLLAQMEKMQTDFDERLEELETELAERQTEEKEAKAAAKKAPTFELGGRIHMDYWNFMENDPAIGFFENPNPSSDSFGDDPEDRFLFRRIRLEFEGQIPQNMLWRMQVDFNNPSQPEYKDVYFGWRDLLGNNQFLIGNQKRPLGLDHLNSSRYNVFAERPLVVEAFNEDARRIGACFYGHSNDESVNYRLGIFNLENTSTSGRYIGDSMQLGGYGRLAATPWYDQASGGRGYFHWAIAGAVARPDGDQFPGDSNSNEARFRTRPLARSTSRWLNTGRISGAEAYEILALESVLNFGRLQLTGEYMANFLQRDNVTAGTGDDVFFQGFYVYASYFLTGEHMPFNRKRGVLGRVKPFENFFLVDRLSGGSGSGWGAWQIAARYDYLDLTDADITGGIGEHYTLGLNWHWNAYSKVQNNLILGDIKERGPINGFERGTFLIAGMRFMCDF